MPDEATRRKMPYDYARLLNSGDVEGVVRLFTEDVIFEDPVGRPPLLGRDALRTHLTWAVEGKVHEVPARCVTSMDDKYVVTHATVTINVPEETFFRIMSIVEVNDEGLGTHVHAFWGLTDMTAKRFGRAAGPAPAPGREAPQGQL